MPKLHPHIGVPALRHRVLTTCAAIAFLLALTGLNACFLPRYLAAHKSDAVATAQGNLAVLSPEDTQLYRDAFALERSGQALKADAVLAKVHEPLLHGVFLGERYLAQSKENPPSFSELALWLARYGDHVQAAELYHIAQALEPDEADFLTQPPTPPAIKGSEPGHAHSLLSESKQWTTGLAAFRKGDMKEAEAHFKVLLASHAQALSADDRAAVSFWAYRAAAAAEDSTAATFLAAAATEPPGFYSLLARQTLEELNSASAASDLSPFLEKAAVRRAIALKSIGQDALAEKELRAIALKCNDDDRKNLAQLARVLRLPGSELRFSVAGGFDPKASTTFYPLPHWKPATGYRIEPALLFAIMRQESGFNPNAKSASGAVGVMQLMPATVQAMAQGAPLGSSREPSVSMMLGQHYLERLMETPAISDNLIYLIGAYNAGPGAMINWQKSQHAGNDPLLFIESIPSVQARDYVVRVIGNYWVYSELLGGANNASIKAMAENHWPHYERTSGQTLAMASRLNGIGAE